MQTELNKVVTALSEFYAHETFLLEKDVGERALTHRLAVHLEQQFAGWQVDCDYDRLGERTLRLPHGSIISTDDHLGKSIYPDIVVHQREIPEQSARGRGPEIGQSPAAGARPAQAAGADRSASVVRLLDRRVRDARQEAGHDVGSLYRRRDRSGLVDLVRRTAEGYRFKCRLRPARREGSHSWVSTLGFNAGSRAILTIAFVTAASQAWGQAAPAPAIEPILANPKVVKTLDDIKADDARTLEEQKRITEIPAPPFKEKMRAEYYQKRMQELGFKDAAIDSEGNVIALRKGSAAAVRNSWCRRISTRSFPKAPTSR